MRGDYMICPEHDTDVEQCNCITAQSLLELSGKQMSDGVTQEEADAKALELYEQTVKGQFRLEL